MAKILIQDCPNCDQQPFVGKLNPITIGVSCRHCGLHVCRQFGYDHTKSHHRNESLANDTLHEMVDLWNRIFVT